MMGLAHGKVSECTARLALAQRLIKVRKAMIICDTFLMFRRKTMIISDTFLMFRTNNLTVYILVVYY